MCVLQNEGVTFHLSGTVFNVQFPVWVLPWPMDEVQVNIIQLEIAYRVQDSYNIYIYIFICENEYPCQYTSSSVGTPWLLSY